MRFGTHPETELTVMQLDLAFIGKGKFLEAPGIEESLLDTTGLEHQSIARQGPVI
jgi:hypothetical protein